MADSPSSITIPRVGVGVIIVRDGLILLGERMGSHGAGTWALPGGHLEFCEAVEDCARRETLEETGLLLQTVTPAPYTNDIMPAEGKHYVTVFVQATANRAEPQTLEPGKCRSWHWFRWSAMSEKLFQPLKTLYRQGFVPGGAT